MEFPQELSALNRACFAPLGDSPMGFMPRILRRAICLSDLGPANSITFVMTTKIEKSSCRFRLTYAQHSFFEDAHRFVVGSAIIRIQIVARGGLACQSMSGNRSMKVESRPVMRLDGTGV